MNELDMINGCTCLPKYPGWSPCEGCQVNKLRSQLKQMSELVDIVVQGSYDWNIAEHKKRILNPEDSTQNEKTYQE